MEIRVCFNVALGTNWLPVMLRAVSRVVVVMARGRALEE